MFKENKRRAVTDTLIGEGTLCEGKMVCESNLRIEGEFRGEIECSGDVVIGEIGVARSNISARDVTVAGKVYGDVVTKGRLVITSSGHFTGNITAAAIIVQDGGKLNGICLMEQTAEMKHRSSHSDADASMLPAKETNSKEKPRQAG